MSYLSDLVTATRKRLEQSRGVLNEATLEQRIASQDPPKGLRAALLAETPSVIAEIKRRSPSKGPLDLGLDAAALARAYADGGAAAISVLTEPEAFEGSLDDLRAARGAGLPVLRKDFILDEFQILESRAEGADAVLLIVRAVGRDLERLVKATSALGMDALVEVFDEADLDLALEVDADLIGINHRDLETFEVHPTRTAELAPRIPEPKTVVALSGVATRREVEELVASGARSLLIGESLVTAPDPAAKLRELLGR